eukprot:3632184-Amphidinium_carterae.1
MPRVSTVIMSIEGEEKCTAHEEIELIGDLFWCEDSGDQLDVEQVKIGMEREIRKMADLGVRKVIHSSEVSAANHVWTGRWCHRKRNRGVRSRYVVQQKRGGRHRFAVRILLGIATVKNHAAIS